MLKKRVKAKEGENLSDANIKKVISLLEADENKITKKTACEMLNISYNTTRLDTIIENFKHDQQVRKELRAKRRGTPPTKDEISSIIKNYLEGDPIYKISERVYRPIPFIKNILFSYGIPMRVPGANFWEDVPLIPEKAVKEEFKVGETVYSARYHGLALVKNIFVDGKGQKVYSLYILGDDNNFRAYQPWYELASLEHLKELGVLFS